MYSWKSTSQWMIDSTNTMGATDPNGWSYNVTWERLLEATRRCEGSLDFTGAMVRRRRWIRSRVCDSDEAKEKLKEAINILMSERSKIEINLLNMQTEYDSVMAYEKERVRLSEDTCAISRKKLALITADLRQCFAKLEVLKQVLILN